MPVSKSTAKRTKLNIIADIIKIELPLSKSTNVIGEAYNVIEKGLSRIVAKEDFVRIRTNKLKTGIKGEYLELYLSIIKKDPTKINISFCSSNFMTVLDIKTEPKKCVCCVIDETSEDKKCLICESKEPENFITWDVKENKDPDEEFASFTLKLYDNLSDLPEFNYSMMVYYDEFNKSMKK